MSILENYGRIKFPDVSASIVCYYWHSALVIQAFISSSLKHCHLLFPDCSVFCLSKTLFQAIWKKYLFSIYHHIFLKYTRVMRKNRRHLHIDVLEGDDNLLCPVVSRFWPCGHSVHTDTTKAGQFGNNMNMLKAFKCCYRIWISLVLAYWSSNFHW